MAIYYQREPQHALLVCSRIENSCCQADVIRHMKSKGHLEQQRALQSTATISQCVVPIPSVGGVSAQEVKVGYV